MTVHTLLQHKPTQLAAALMIFALPLLLIRSVEAEQQNDLWQRTSLSVSSIVHITSAGRGAPALYAIVVGGGIRRSVDDGQTWEEANQGLPTGSLGNIPVHIIAGDPNDPLTVFAAVNILPTQGAIYRSTDGARTWSLVTVGPTPGRVTALTVTNADIAYATIGTQLFMGLNGGSTWVFQGAWPGSAEARAIATNPDDPRHVYVLTSAGLFASTDGGITWSDVSPRLAAFDPTTVAVAPFSSAVYVGTRQGLLRSDDGGQTWSLLTGLPADTGVRAIVWDEAPGVGFVATEQTIYKTLDGGLTWRELGSGLQPRIVYALTQGKRGELFAATIAGVWRLTTTLPPLPTATATPTATDTPTTTPTPSPTATATATATPSNTPTPTFSATPTFTSTSTPRPSATATPTPTITPLPHTATPTALPTVPPAPPPPTKAPPTATPQPPTPPPVPPTPTNTRIR